MNTVRIKNNLEFDALFANFGGHVFVCYIGELPHKVFDFDGCYRGSKSDWNDNEKQTIRIANTPIGGESTEFSKKDFCLSPSDSAYKGYESGRRRLNGE